MNNIHPISDAIHKLQQAQAHAMSIRPKVGGFPVLAEVLRQAGVQRNTWILPSCQSIYITDSGNVVMQGTPLLSGMSDILLFNQESLIKALRMDQNGESTFPEFLESAWKAGVVRYEVDFEKREVIYYGVLGESYTESYPKTEI